MWKVRLVYDAQKVFLKRGSIYPKLFLYPYLDSREHALDMFKINNNMFRTGQDKPKHFLDIWNILNKNLFF